MVVVTSNESSIPDVNLRLFESLANVYRPADRRRRRPLKFGEAITVSDRLAGEAFPTFYGVSILISSRITKTFDLCLTSVPSVSEVCELVVGHGGEVEPHEKQLCFDAKVQVTISEVGYLRSLAKAYRRSVGRGARYLIPNWKWICPRTASSIDRLADSIMAFRRKGCSSVTQEDLEL